MADDLFSGVPSWVIPAALALVVVLAMLSGRNSSASTLVQRAYEPVPADPNLTALAGQQSNNLTSAFQSVVDLVENADVSQIAAGRDVSLATLQAQSADAKTAAALAASRASAIAQQNIALGSYQSAEDIAAANAYASVTGAQIAGGTSVALANIAGATSTANARAAADTASAQYASQLAIAKTQADAAKSIAGSQENATKSVSKNNVVGSIVHDIVKTIGGFF